MSVVLLPFFLLFTGPVFALQPATPEQVRLIQDYLDTENNLINGPDGINKYSANLTAAENSLDRDEKSIEGIKNEIADLTRQRNLAFDKAIHLALRAYGIIPTDTTGHLISPSG
ncbi:MAG: hypothetical protein KGL74_04100, partial [Elusimicrobia bacterium]|nr:hypothetical protein [Elusimicrobiota bacterium]